MPSPEEEPLKAKAVVVHHDDPVVAEAVPMPVEAQLVWPVSLRACLVTPVALLPADRRSVKAYGQRDCRGPVPSKEPLSRLSQNAFTMCCRLILSATVFGIGLGYVLEYKDNHSECAAVRCCPGHGGKPYSLLEPLGVAGSVWLTRLTGHSC
jgi:hypothetical protein